MTKNEREVCCQVLGFVQTVARAENNVFASGAKEMERLLTTLLFAVVIGEEHEDK